MTALGGAGPVAMVTGATSGIGEATALAMAAAGMRVIVSGRRAHEGDRVVAAIRARGGAARFVPADMTSSADVSSLIDDVVGHEGRLDVAFNNAGIFDRMHEFHDYDDEAWNDMIAVNLTGVFRSMRAELAVMATAGSGVIVNNASTVSHRGSERASPAYVAAKHGVLGLTRQAAVEYADRGIRVNAVAPGPTRTPVAEPLIAEGPDAVRTALAGLNPKADFVDPDHVAAAVLFLCSDAAAMINGQSLAIDGGQLAKL